MTNFGTTPFDYTLEVARGEITGQSVYAKYGGNSDIDTGTTPEDLWNGGSVYTGFNATSGEAIDIVSSDNKDRGTLVDSGTATGGSSTTMVDSGGDFINDGVAVGDCLINDTQQIHGIITGVAATTLTVVRFDDGSDKETVLSFAASDTYRIATAASSGAYVLKMTKMLETDYAEYLTEYVILNGTTSVYTVGTSYIRCPRAIVIAAGSNNGSQGSITGHQVLTTANVFFVMPSDHNQTLICCDTIPAGKTLYVRSVLVTMGRANGSAGSAEVDFDIRPIGQVFNSKLHKYITNSLPLRTEDGYVQRIPEKADFRIRVDDVSDNNTQVSGSISGILVDNNS